jgi:hypothetical protein
MKTARQLLAAILCCALLASAQGNTFTKVRYNGGSVSTSVKPDDWDNKLTVTSEAITFTLKDGQTLTIAPKLVSSLSYGQEAHRRVGTAIGLGLLSLGVGALFALHKTKLHYIGVNYSDKDGKKQALLLQGDKSNFRAIIVALQGVTGVPVAVGEKERGEVPAGVATQVTKETEQSKEKSVTTPSTVAPPPSSTSEGTVLGSPELPGSITISSTPDAAEIYVDGGFVGNSPATLKLKSGKHAIRVTLTGFKEWVRELTVQAGSELKLVATLDKQN